MIKDDSEASLSRDGSEVAFVLVTTDVPRRHELEEALFVVSSEGGRVQRLIGSKELGADVWDPTWSPDGTTIAFDGPSCVTKVANLDVINRDGGVLRRLRRVPAKERGELVGVQPAGWSPDGQRLLYIVDRGEDCGLASHFESSLSMTSLTGGPPTLLASLGDPTHASWSSDGRRVAYSGTQGAGLYPNVGTEFVWDPAGDSLIFADRRELDRVNIRTGRRNLVVGSPPLPKDSRREVGCYPVVLGISSDGRTVAVDIAGNVYLAATDGSRVSPVVELPRSKNVGESVSSIALA